MFHPRNDAVAEVVLATAVADDGTLTVSYPSGFSQLDFNAGLAAYGEGHVMVNDNDKWNEADPGFSFSFGSSDITVTNLTGASLAAGTKLRFSFRTRQGNNRICLALKVNLASITTAQDVVTEIRPGVAGYIEAVEWVQDIPVTTASKLATLNLEIGTTNVTGGALALTSAACTPMGARIAGTQITANNRLEKTSKLSVEAASVTAFAEGSGTVLVYIRLDDNDRS